MSDPIAAAPASTLADVPQFPFWLLEFDENGAPRDAAALAAFVDDVRARGIGDLFVFSHGWNNDHAVALALYDGFFQQVARVLATPGLTRARSAPIGVAGVFWPSILWPDAPPPATPSAGGGVAAFHAAAPAPTPADTAARLNADLKQVFTAPEQQALVDTLTQLLATRPRSEDALRQFKTTLTQLMRTATDSPPTDQDGLEKQGLLVDDDRWRALFQALAAQEPRQGGSNLASLGDVFGTLWNGAKGALRVATYWQMKKRGGNVGALGLGPLIAQLAAAVPELRVHLIGHSFGARLVSYTLKGLPARDAGTPSPVKSLCLLQGAFSHFAFADALPFDRTRAGDLHGMAANVDGPLVATHTLRDTAVGVAYPLASITAQQDAAGQSELLFRWGAMGHDGAQAVNAGSAWLGRPGTRYAFLPGAWLNLDANQVIVNGGPPSGAHGDIVHPETAWAVLAAAGIV